MANISMIIGSATMWLSSFLLLISLSLLDDDRLFIAGLVLACWRIFAGSLLLLWAFLQEWRVLFYTNISIYSAGLLNLSIFWLFVINYADLNDPPIASFVISSFMDLVVSLNVIIYGLCRLTKYEN